MSKKRVHIVGTGTIGEPLIGLFCDFKEELGIDETTVIGSINNIAMSAEKDETKLKALFKLADIMDLEDKSKTSVTQISGAVFQGFDDKVIEEAKRPKEISNE